MKKGFSLIEMTFVIIIIGILLGLTVGTLPIILEQYNTVNTDKKLKEIKSAIVGFTAKNGYLPNNTEFNSLVSNINDGWNSTINFSPSSRLINDDVCFRGSTEKNITIGSNTTDDIAFTIQSKGKNMNSQLDISLDDLTIPALGSFVDNDNSDGSTTKEFDDRLDWMTLSELRTLSGCQTHTILITSNELPFGNVNQTYNGKIFASGGIKFSDNTYEWCIVSEEIPTGLNFTNTLIADDYTNCVWTRGENIIIDSVPTQSGSFNLNVYVRDDNEINNQNETSKNFTITINPEILVSTVTNSSQVSFANNIGDLVEVESGGDSVQVNGDELRLLNNLNSSSACSWFPNSIPFKDTSIYVYFNFEFSKIESDPTQDNGYADGFTFSLIEESIGDNVCGSSGERLGYAGIVGSSYAIEFDIYRNGNQNDPTGNHTSLQKNGSVQHVNNDLSGDCSLNDNTSGCRYWNNNESSHFETGNIHNVKLEIKNGYNANCTNQNGGNYTKFTVYQDLLNLDQNLNQDYVGTPTIIGCNYTDSNFENTIIGFTAGSGGQNQTVIIRDFELEYVRNN